MIIAIPLFLCAFFAPQGLADEMILIRRIMIRAEGPGFAIPVFEQEQNLFTLQPERKGDGEFDLPSLSDVSSARFVFEKFETSKIAVLFSKVKDRCETPFACRPEFYSVQIFFNDHSHAVVISQSLDHLQVVLNLPAKETIGAQYKTDRFTLYLDF